MENENQSVSGINRPRGLRLIEFIEVMYYIPRKENVGTTYNKEQQSKLTNNKTGISYFKFYLFFY